VSRKFQDVPKCHYRTGQGDTTSITVSSEQWDLNLFHLCYAPMLHLFASQLGLGQGPGSHLPSFPIQPLLHLPSSLLPFTSQLDGPEWTCVTRNKVLMTCFLPRKQFREV
jgi:hypothetical protein